MDQFNAHVTIIGHHGQALGELTVESRGHLNEIIMCARNGHGLIHLNQTDTSRSHIPGHAVARLDIAGDE